MVDDPQFNDEPTWCISYQLPHDVEYCAVVLSCPINQNEIEEQQEHEDNNEDVG